MEEINIHKEKNYKGRDRRLLEEWELLYNYCSGNDKISYIIRKRNEQGLPIAYDIIFRIKSIVGVEEPDEQGLQRPVFGNEHVMRIMLPNNYPGADGLPTLRFTTDVWHPSVLSYGDENFKGLIDFYTGERCVLVDIIDRIIGYLTYKDYYAKNEYPLPQDLEVAEWVREQAEPNGWLNFAQEMGDAQNKAEGKKMIEIVVFYRSKSVVIKTNPDNTIEQFIKEIKKQANENPDESFRMPMCDWNKNGCLILYFLKRIKYGQDEYLSLTQNGKIQTLNDHNINNGDELFIEKLITDQIIIEINYNGKSTSVAADLNDTIEYLLKEIIRWSKEYPDRLFDIPETDMTGNSIPYILTKINKDGQTEILKHRDCENRNLTLHDYNIYSGDEFIIQKGLNEIASTDHSKEELFQSTESIEKRGIKVILSYQNKNVAVRVENPRQSIKLTLENLIKVAKNDPERLWHLPEMHNAEYRTKYFFGRRTENGSFEILHEEKYGEDRSLFDYNVKDGDTLYINMNVCKKEEENNIFTVNDPHETIKQTIKSKIECDNPFYLYKYQLFKIDDKGVYEELNIYEIWNNENKKLSYYGIKEGDRLTIREKHRRWNWFEIIEDEKKDIKISVSYKGKKYLLKTENSTDIWLLLHDLKELYEIFDYKEWNYCYLYRKNLLGKTEQLKTKDKNKTNLCLLDYGIQDGDELIIKKNKLISFFMRLLYIIVFPIILLMDFKSIIRSKKIKIVICYKDRKFALPANSVDSIFHLKLSAKNLIESISGEYLGLRNFDLCRKNTDGSYEILEENNIKNKSARLFDFDIKNGTELFIVNKGEENLNSAQERSDAQNKADDKDLIRIIFAYECRRIALRINPHNSINQIIENIKEQAKGDPEKMWNIPEFDMDGNPIRYYLGRKNDNGRDEILKQKETRDLNLTLGDYGVNSGDELLILQKEDQKRNIIVTAFLRFFAFIFRRKVTKAVTADYEHVEGKISYPINIFIDSKGQQIPFETNSQTSIDEFLNETIQFADTCPEDLLYMPVYDNEYNTMPFFVARVKNGQTEVLVPQSKESKEMTLFDYGVKDGDSLTIVKRVIT